MLDEKLDTKPKTAGLKTSPTVAPNHGPSASPSTKPSSALFKGDIAGKAGKEKLYAFLEKNDKKTVQLDLLLSDEQLNELDDLGQGKAWYFDLAYPDQDGYNTGGELLIDIAKGKGGLRLDGNHLTGQIKVTSLNGPHQGLMSIKAKPVIETTETKLTTTGKASPSVKPKGTM